MRARGARGPGHRWGFQGSDPRTLCGQAVRNIPLEVAACAPEAHVDPVIYTPPALRQRCAGWYPGIGTAWENWGMPQYST